VRNIKKLFSVQPCRNLFRTPLLLEKRSHSKFIPVTELLVAPRTGGTNIGLLLSFGRAMMGLVDAVAVKLMLNRATVPTG